MPIPPDALGDLIDRHWGPLLAWVGRCDGAAEDVVQQAFIRLASTEPAPEHPVGWLYRVSRRLAINEHKSQARRRQRHNHVARSQQQPQPCWQSAEASELIELLQQLPDDCRQVVVARLWGDLTFEEIAVVVGASPATVWRRYGEALEMLRKTYQVQCQVNS